MGNHRGRPSAGGGDVTDRRAVEPGGGEYLSGNCSHGNCTIANVYNEPLVTSEKPMTETVNGTNRSAGPTYQDYLDLDSHPVRRSLGSRFHQPLGQRWCPSSDTSLREFHELYEVKKVWKRVSANGPPRRRHPRRRRPPGLRHRRVVIPGRTHRAYEFKAYWKRVPAPREIAQGNRWQVGGVFIPRLVLEPGRLAQRDSLSVGLRL